MHRSLYLRIVRTYIYFGYGLRSPRQVSTFRALSGGLNVQSAQVASPVHTEEAATNAFRASVRAPLSRPEVFCVRERSVGSDFEGELGLARFLIYSVAKRKILTCKYEMIENSSCVAKFLKTYEDYHHHLMSMLDVIELVSGSFIF